MGSVCQAEQKTFRKIEQYTHPDNVYSPFKRAQHNHSRFGNIEKIRTKKADIYKLIMATNDVKMQTVSIECRVMESIAEFELYEGTKFQLQDHLISPVMDPFEASPSQIYHPILNASRQNLTLKSYPFSSYSDNNLKRAIYQIWIHNQLRSSSPLLDYFIMSRNKTNTMVMVFKNFECSLFEIVRYRQLAEYHWKEQELVTIWKVIINNYKQLATQSISHRQIRLSSILFTPDSKNQPFQLANLSTARKTTKAEANDLLTVVGVNIFAEPPLRDKIESEAVLASYDPFAYDIACLIRVLLSILNLNPLENGPLVCRNEQLSPIIQQLRSGSPNFNEMEKHLDSILRNLTYEKNELFREDRTISEHLCKSELRRCNRERIEETYFDSLLELHKKELFNRLLIEKIEENDKANKKFENIAILHKVGEYYSKIGLEKNEYFEEEFMLLLELCKDCREQQFRSEHEEYLNQLQKLQGFISKERYELPIRLSNELVHKYLTQQKLERANQQLSSLLEQTYAHNDIHINTQLEILITKVEVEIANSQFEVSENTLEKMSFIISNSPFESQYDTKRFQGEVEYLKASHEISVMSKRREEVKKKRIAVAEASLTTVLSIFTNLPQSNQNTIKIVNAYLLRSDLCNIKEAFPQSKASLQSADVLLSELEKSQTVSDSLKLKLVQRLKLVYEKSNKTGEPSYKQILSRQGKLTKIFEESNASRYQRSKQEKKRNKESNRQKSIFRKDVIQEQYQEEED